MPPKIFSTSNLQSQVLKKGENVKLVVDMPTVSAGTAGKVAIANGLTWKRYWVRFNDGQILGHVDHFNLVKSKHYDRYMAARQREAENEKQGTKSASANSSQRHNPDASSTGLANQATMTGVTIPSYLLERSAAARARLGG